MAIELLCRPLTHSNFCRRIEGAEESKCSDSRNRIYTLLSINEQTNFRLKLTLDYRMPVEQVHRAATLEVMKVAESIDILSSCELRLDSKY